MVLRRFSAVWLLMFLVSVLVAACGGGGSTTSSAKAITAYSLNGVTGTINETGKTIAVTVPYGTDVTTLVATFTTTGSGVTVGTTPQVSGATANDFSSPLTYTVTAADGSTSSYTVTVLVAASSAKAITAFSLAGVTASINETYKSIGIVLPYGTDVHGLIATFISIGTDVKVNGVTQTSGVTANDFSSPVNYVVTAADGSTVSYTVTVAVALNTAKAITAFSLNGVAGTVNESNKSITVTMPAGTDVTTLIATFTTTGASVAVRATPQLSGSTPNDFTNPVSYDVSAADGSTASYTVTVAIATNPAMAITQYSLAGIYGVINETTKTIWVIMPYGTNVTSLVATFTTTGASVAVGATPQISGATPNDFTSPVAYTVTAADGSTSTYVVAVAVALNSAKAITAYSLNGVAGIINEANKTIAVTVPYGTDVTTLVATFTITGANVTVGATPQISGTTANNFVSPVIYTVTAADGSFVNYTVTVAVAPNPAKAITAFSLNGVVGTIDEANKAIAVTMPYGTNVTALVANFTITGVSIKIGSTIQYSGFYSNDFTSSVIYTVIAADGTTADYTVTVTVALNSAKAITAYSLAGIPGTIDEPNKTIAVTMPFGTAPSTLTTLVATFTTTGASVRVGATTQVSGTTANDFANPVTYTVTADDGSTANYTVTVTIALNPAKAITSFSLNGVTGMINETDKTITAPMSSATNVTALVATFTTTGASVKIGTTVQVSGTTANDFTNPVNFTVTAEDGASVNYRVTVLSQSVAWQINHAHSGQTDMAGTISFPVTPTWSVTLGGAASYPLIAGGKVFVMTAGLNGGYGTNLYALDKATGTTVWGPVAVAGTYFWAGHAYDNGKLFVVNYNGLLKSFDAATGIAGWSVQLPGQYAFSSPPTAINGIVYIGGSGSGGTLYAVDESNGNLLWSKSVANGDDSSPAVSSDGVFVTYPCQAYKFDPLSGAALWHYSGGCGGGGGRTPVYANGSLYMRDWTKSTSLIFNAATGVQTGTFTATPMPAVTAQAGYYLSAGTLRRYDLNASTPSWSFAGDGSLVTSPVIINNQYVIVGSSSGNVYAVDATTGTQLWSNSAGAAISAPDEQNVSAPRTGFGAGEEFLIVPAGSKVTAWKIIGP